MSKYQKSPLAPKSSPSMAPVPGVEMAAVAAGLRYQDRLDLLLVTVCEGAAAAGVFTKSKAPSAPVEWSKKALDDSKGAARAVVVNAGNANAFTGASGRKATAQIAAAAAGAIGCADNQILQASTGVIGEVLDAYPIKRFVKILAAGLSKNLWHDAAKAILTTDTFPKGASKTARIGGQSAVITGFAKGSGMIAPDMATMLGFIFTNANISSDCLQQILSETTEHSFNSITVDSDTSTSDTVFAFATKQSSNREMITDPADPRLEDFRHKFAEVMLDLAHQVVKDGEGASKFVEITVTGAATDAAAKTIGLSIANSPLVKTAIAGEDPNWGRIVMAVGKAGEAADRDKLEILIGGQLVARNGLVSKRYSEEKAAKHMQGDHIDINVDVGIGEGKATVWTCDFTDRYISINADYRS